MIGQQPVDHGHGAVHHGRVRSVAVLVHCLLIAFAENVVLVYHIERIAPVASRFCEPIVEPRANLQKFKNKVNLEGGTPYDPMAAGRFAVLLEPLDVNAIGRGIVAGVTPVKLVVEIDHLYDFAKMEPVHTLSLRNAPTESARMLWLEESGSKRTVGGHRLFQV